jgi:uncharacterized membrane protein
VSGYQWALFLHLLGVGVLFAGMGVAGAAHGAARRRERPSEIALLLRLARVGVALVAAGGLVVLVAGLWLIEETGSGLDNGWLAASLGIFLIAFVLGGVGGQRPKRARLLAERLAAERDAPSDELSRLLGDRIALALNYASAAAIVVVLLLMIWKPGG